MDDGCEKNERKRKDGKSSVEWFGDMNGLKKTSSATLSFYPMARTLQIQGSRAWTLKGTITKLVNQGKNTASTLTNKIQDTESSIFEVTAILDAYDLLSTRYNPHEID